jgi:hypothetical protein
MNIIEFSIACKLISSKLRNVEVPKYLPPTLIQSLQHVGTPIRTPTGQMSPTESYKQFLTQQPVTAVPMQIQTQPIVQQQPNIVQQPAMPIMTPQQQQQPIQYQQQPIIQNQQPAVQMVPTMINQGITTSSVGIPQQQQPIMMQQQPQLIQQQVIPPQQIMMNQAPQTQILAQQQQQYAQQTILPQSVIVAPIQTKAPLIDQLSSGSLLDSLSQVQTAPISGNIPAAPTPTPPQSGNASRSMSFSEKAPSVPESP